ncbi:MAG: hypothetical protein U9R17_05295, partial [Thermodesulfobacteriota bacterium]|nr:hypothetical protein [Thermodesulfobacteriota bacterium]
SKIFALMPFHQNRLPRLAFIQFMKRFPINLRRILLVPKEQNPKGLALFTSALIKLSDTGLIDSLDLIDDVIKKLIKLKSPNQEHFCWGYNFDWQNRSFFLPKFSPNIICTTFAANALLDFYEKYHKTEYLDIAISAGYFLLSGLNKTEDDTGICFSYTPFDHGQVHNANLLGAAFLSRLYSITGEKKSLNVALKAVRFSVSRQNEDGSWPYGEGKTQKWIDNFHTGYNLIALQKFKQYTGNESFTDNIQRGFEFYLNNLFTPKGVPKYYHNSTFPIDIHSIAQSIITLTELSNLDDSAIDMAILVYGWAINNMQNKKGYFFYQQKKFFKNRISYMRWSQAWMLYALSTLLEHEYCLKEN